MASHGHGPPDDPSLQLSSTVETETAWGRSRFTEAEIKIAFELRDHELRRAEDEAAALQASKRAGANATMKGDGKRGETKKTEVRRKEEPKAKKKDDGKSTAVKKAGPGDAKDAATSLDELQALEHAEAESWRTLMTYNFTQDAQDLASLMAEQKRAESFEEWALASPSPVHAEKYSTRAVFESIKYQVRVLLIPFTTQLMALIEIIPHAVSNSCFAPPKQHTFLSRVEFISGPIIDRLGIFISHYAVN